jgi:hypothetical protein
MRELQRDVLVGLRGFRCPEKLLVSSLSKSLSTIGLSSLGRRKPCPTHPSAQKEPVKGNLPS